MAQSADELQRYMDASPFIASCGMRISEADAEAERLVVEMPMQPQFERGANTGQFHGGPIAALIAGGVGAVVTVGLWAKIFPVLRTTKTFDPPEDLLEGGQTQTQA